MLTVCFHSLYQRKKTQAHIVHHYSNNRRLCRSGYERKISMSSNNYKFTPIAIALFTVVLLSMKSFAGALVGPAVDVDTPVTGVIPAPVYYNSLATASNGKIVLTVYNAASVGGDGGREDLRNRARCGIPYDYSAGGDADCPRERRLLCSG